MPEETKSPPTPQVKSGLNWSHVLIGTLVGALLIGFGFLIYTILYPPKDTSTENKVTPTTKTASNSATPSATKVDTTNWNLFVNTKYNYSFKYPKSSALINNEGVTDLKTLETSGDLTVSLNDTGAVVFGIIADGPCQITCSLIDLNNKPLDTIEENLKKDPTYSNIRRVKIDGVQALRATNKDTGGDEIQVVHGVRFYIDSGSIDKLFDQILSTFRFL